MPSSAVTVETLISLLTEHKLLETEDEIRPDSDLFSLGMDSLATMQLLLHLEREFGISLTPDMIQREHFTTPEKLACLLNQVRAL